MRSQWVESGRFPDDEDVRLQRRVAFIGSEVARKVFGTVPPVGQRIRIGGMSFDVIGVQKEKVQLSNYLRPDRGVHLHPLHDRRPALEHGVHHRHGVPGGGCDRGGAGDARRA
ncbi:MAG: ABC transporter permease [Vicinamibacterales bacterium]